MALKLLVVADDLTGAHDCASRLTALGGPVPTARQAKYLRSATATSNAVVLDAETRFLPSAQARWRSIQAWIELKQIAQAPYHFQKLDSTLRGNPGEEVEGMLQSTAAPWIAVLPAYPSVGRQTLGGRHFVHGQPLELTEYAQDPLTPARVARPQDLFNKAMVLHVPLAWIRTGPARLKTKLSHALKRRPARFVTFDCEIDSHVDVIAATALRMNCRHFAGASGLAGALAKCLGGERNVGANSIPRGLPWFFVVGSVSERSFEQLRQAQQSGVLSWFPLQKRTPTEILRRARRQGPLALSTLAKREDLKTAKDGEAAIQAMVRTALQVSPLGPKTGWFLTGGHSALRFFQKTQWQRFDAVCEILPGLAVGWAFGAHGGAWVASKPGGFGSPDLFSRFLKMV